MRLGTAIIEKALENQGITLLEVCKLDKIKIYQQYANHIIAETLINYPSLIKQLIFLVEVVDEVKLAPTGDRSATKPYLFVEDEEMRCFIKTYRRLKIKYLKLKKEVSKERNRLRKKGFATSQKQIKLQKKADEMSKRLESMRKRKVKSNYHIMYTLVINGTY